MNYDLFDNIDERKNDLLVNFIERFTNAREVRTMRQPYPKGETHFTVQVIYPSSKKEYELASKAIVSWRQALELMQFVCMKLILNYMKRSRTERG